MNKYFNNLLKFLSSSLTPAKIDLPSQEKFEIVRDQFLLENIKNHQTYSAEINSHSLWDNFKFNHNLGSMVFSYNDTAFALALDRESIDQGEAMSKLNKKLTIYTKVLEDGSILANLSSVEFNLVLHCYSIKKL